MNPHKGRCSLCMLNDMFVMLKSQQLPPAEEKMVIFTLWSLPGLHAHTAWTIISALINSKKPIA